ncbi:MAG: hypothetical protein ACLR3R_19565 [Clostridium paraputrificum]
MYDLKSDITTNVLNQYTVHYNKVHLEKYLKIVQYGGYIDGVVLDSICGLLRKVYYYIFDAKLGEIRNPLIAVRRDWFDDMVVYAYAITQFADDVCSALGENLDKINLKEIRNELEKIYNKHDLIYSAIESQMEESDSFYHSNVSRFYNVCKQNANPNSLGVSTIF